MDGLSRRGAVLAMGGCRVDRATFPGKVIAESFGSTQIIEQDIEVSLRFPGHYCDQEARTHDNFHRDYRPNAGRYLQSDPIGLEGRVNVYGYVNLHPLNNVDFLGLYGGSDILGAYFYYCRGSGEPWNVDFHQ